jgi:hypothetical protein
MRTIRYTLKTTQANTQYYKILETDRQWLLDQCKSICDFVNVGLDHNDDEIQNLVKRLKKPSRDYGWRSHAHGGGCNSIYTICAGVVDNFTRDTQYDFSEKTATLVTRAFKRASELELAVEPVEFVERGGLIDAQDQISSFLDLFDVNITVTVARKDRK